MSVLHGRVSGNPYQCCQILTNSQIASSLVEYRLILDLLNELRPLPWDVLLWHLDEPVIARDRRNRETRRTRYVFAKPDLRSLLALRLVSRAWRASADLVLEKHHSLVLDLDDPDRLAAAVKAYGPPGGSADAVAGASRLVREWVIPQICAFNTSTRTYCTYTGDGYVHYVLSFAALL